MSGDRICLNRYEFTYMSIQSRETVLKVPYLCCFSIMDIQVPPVPNQPKTFRFPQQGRRRDFESGPAERSAEGTTGGRAREGGLPPPRWGGLGDLPQENF